MHDHDRKTRYLHVACTIFVRCIPMELAITVVYLNYYFHSYWSLHRSSFSGCTKEQIPSAMHEKKPFESGALAHQAHKDLGVSWSHHLHYVTPNVRYAQCLGMLSILFPVLMVIYFLSS